MKVVLSIAGSDSSGGAGIQADLKTFEAFGVFGTTALTVVTAQNTTGVTHVQAMSCENIEAQLEAVYSDFEIAAVKVGMLYSTEIIETVAKFLHKLDVPIVLDPVFISKAGAPLLQNEAVQSMKKLFRHVTLITPNLYEAEALFGYEVGDSTSLHKIIHCPCPVLVKNQILESQEGAMSIDQLYMGHKKRVFQTPYIYKALNLHGTGCSFSSAITAGLALGYSLDTAIDNAKKFIYEAILDAPRIGHGSGPILHSVGVKYA